MACELALGLAGRGANRKSPRAHRAISSSSTSSTSTTTSSSSSSSSSSSGGSNLASCKKVVVDLSKRHVKSLEKLVKAREKYLHDHGPEGWRHESNEILW